MEDLEAQILLQMKIKITSVNRYLIIDRKLKVGDTFEVIKVGKSYFKPNKTFYYIEPNGKPTVIYDNECTIISK